MIVLIFFFWINVLKYFLHEDLTYTVCNIYLSRYDKTQIGLLICLYFSLTSSGLLSFMVGSWVRSNNMWAFCYSDPRHKNWNICYFTELITYFLYEKYKPNKWPVKFSLVDNMVREVTGFMLRFVNGPRERQMPPYLCYGPNDWDPSVVIFQPSL